jgi:hypothetical protein
MTEQTSILPDLARYRCNYVLMQGKVPSRFGTVSLNEVVGRRIAPGKPFDAEDFYSASGRTHTALVTIGRYPRRANQISILLRCLPNEVVNVGGPSQFIGLLQRLTELRFESAFTYDIGFTLGRKAAMRLFPLKLPLLPGTIMDEIRGFRGVKHEGAEIAYQLSIESPELKELYVSIELSRNEVFNLDLLPQTLREAAGIMAGIVPEAEWSD